MEPLLISSTEASTEIYVDQLSVLTPPSVLEMDLGSTENGGTLKPQGPSVLDWKRMVLEETDTLGNPEAGSGQPRPPVPATPCLPGTTGFRPPHPPSRRIHDPTLHVTTETAPVPN